jgi:ribose 5-phosphate isomerase A
MQSVLRPLSLLVRSMSSLTPIETAKKLAAYRAVDLHVRDGDVVGIGSGSTVVYAVSRLAERVSSENLKVTCVPSSFQATQLITSHGLPLSDLNQNPHLHVVIDGADEVDAQLNCIKGGGGCQLQEKMLIYAADKFVIIADERKDSQTLGETWKRGIPIEVVPTGYVSLQRQLERLSGVPTLRMAQCKAGPVVTDNGNFILDTVVSLRLK